MLFCDIIDLLYTGFGVLLGMLVVTIIDMVKCDNCRKGEEDNE